MQGRLPKILVAAIGIAMIAGMCRRAPVATARGAELMTSFTGRLIQLNADQNGDGRIDQWSYVDGSPSNPW
jgi:hypothetical protein